MTRTSLDQEEIMSKCSLAHYRGTVFIMLLSLVTFYLPSISPLYSTLGKTDNVSMASDDLAWSTRASMPTARGSLGVVVASNGRIYAIGGQGGTTGALATVEEYDPATDAWRSRANMLTSRRAFGVTAATNGKIYAIGGHNGSDWLATVEEYDPITNTWRFRSNMPTARVALGVAASNGKIYAIGGLPDGKKVEEYDPATDTWRSRADMPTSRSSVGVVTASNGKIYAIGGQGSGLLATVEEYDPATDMWRSRADMSVTRENPGVVAASNGKVYAIGGQHGFEYLRIVEEYDPATNTWTSGASMPTGRTSLGVVEASNGKLYAIGGYDGDKFVATVEEATIDSPGTPPNDSCKISSGTWQNNAFSPQTGTFTASFDAIPNNANMDGVTGLSTSLASNFTDLAAIIRFNSNGFIDARNGSAYAAATQIPYTVGVTYHFRLVVRVPSHTYDIFVTPTNGIETVVGTNFAFRTEQESVTSLSNWALFAQPGTGSHTVCNFSISSSAPLPPNPSPYPAPSSSPSPMPPSDTSIPGGVWISPEHNFVVTNNQLHFAVHAYDNQSGSGIKEVKFTAFYSESWHVVCTDVTPNPGTDIYECDWSVVNVPVGPITVSFDAYDNAGNYTLAPNGTREGEVRLPPMPSPIPVPTPTPPVQPKDGCIYFAETQRNLCGRFRTYWEQNGGLAVFGFPITEASNEVNRDTGKTYPTQWFERNRFELHSENAAPYDVLLGRLGDDRLRQLGRNWSAEPRESGGKAGCLWFEQTGHNVCDQVNGLGFKTNWQTHGLRDPRLNIYEQSLALFGLPLTEPRMETNASGDTVLTQWFERARFEWHPGKPDQFKVLLGLLGNEVRAVSTTHPSLPEIDYFGLGDSIASGHGLRDTGAICRRSDRAYPHKVVANLKERFAKVNFPVEHFRACSGSSALQTYTPQPEVQLLHNQVEDILTQLSNLPSNRPKLVSITIGANDFQFSDPANIEARLYRDSEESYNTWVDNTSTLVKNALKTELARLLEYENVKIVVTEVYNPFNKSSVFFMYSPLGDRCLGLVKCYARTERAVQVLNAALTAAVMESSIQWPGRVKVAKIYDDFQQHKSPRYSCGNDLPDADDTWIQRKDDTRDSNSLPDIDPNIGPPGRWWGDCFHPNERGAQAIADAVSEIALELGY